MPACFKWSFYIRFPYQNLVCTSPLPHMCHMTHPSHSSRFDHPNNIGWGVQIMKHLAMQSPPVPCYLVPFRPKFLENNFKLRFTTFDFSSKWFVEWWNSGLEAPSDTSCVIDEMLTVLFQNSRKLQWLQQLGSLLWDSLVSLWSWSTSPLITS